MKLNIMGKILLGFGLVLLLMCGAGWYLISQMKGINTSYTTLVNEKAYSYVFAESARAEINMTATLIRGYMIDGDPEAPAKIENSYNNAHAYIDKLVPLVTTDEGKQLIEDYKVKIDAFKTIIIDQLIPLVKARELAEGAERDIAEQQITDFYKTNQNVIVELNTTANAFSAYEARLLEEGNKTNTDNVNKTIKISVSIFFMLLALGIIIAVYITRMIANPINLVNREAAKIATGDLTGEEIKVKSNDEAGQLAESFNNMLNNLKKITKQLQDKSRDVASSAAELSASAENVSAAANENAATIGEVASTVEQVTTNVQNIADNATQASSYAREGSEELKRVISQIEAIQETSSASGKVVSGLSESAGKITQIVELITSIADQTNLLALNAAIESARAGEHGRGFAVVAEEVRKLAEQSAGAAKEIYTLIHSIQQESQRAVKSMEQSSNQVEAGVQVIREIGATMENIITAVQGLAGEIQSVAAATEQINSGVQNVAAATEEQTATTEEIASTTQKLAGLSEELEELSRGFKLSQAK